ncbi:hypothetical protein [Nocardia otitidiscaviarum]|uniref:hypothetical protein n=1 Tax=Nocardia otitidiscaviarum TaxID=1823 RepID=UPI0024586CBD|nr:hypothetical protein [Nocardia otitidiscaviarum]
MNAAAARVDAFSDWGARGDGVRPLRGADSFTGPQLHCDRWTDQLPLAGQRVAVIGSAAAIARVLPRVAERARKVTVFQHDPVWVLPRPPLPDFTAAASAAARLLPFGLARRAAAANLRLQVPDSWTRRQLTPEAPARVTWHNHYYRTLHRPHVRLITWPIARLAPRGIRTVDGIEHRVDCVIYAEETS